MEMIIFYLFLLVCFAPAIPIIFFIVTGAIGVMGLIGEGIVSIFKSIFK